MRLVSNEHNVILTSITSKLQSVGPSWQQSTEALALTFPANRPTSRIRSAPASTRTMLMRLSAQNACSSMCWILHPTSSLTFPGDEVPSSSRHTITDSGFLKQPGAQDVKIGTLFITGININNIRTGQNNVHIFYLYYYYIICL